LVVHVQPNTIVLQVKVQAQLNTIQSYKHIYNPIQYSPTSTSTCTTQYNSPTSKSTCTTQYNTVLQVQVHVELNTIVLQVKVHVQPNITQSYKYKYMYNPM